MLDHYRSSTDVVEGRRIKIMEKGHWVQESLAAGLVVTPPWYPAPLLSSEDRWWLRASKVNSLALPFGFQFLTIHWNPFHWRKKWLQLITFCWVSVTCHTVHCYICIISSKFHNIHKKQVLPTFYRRETEAKRGYNCVSSTSRISEPRFKARSFDSKAHTPAVMKTSNQASPFPSICLVHEVGNNKKLLKTVSTRRPVGVLGNS